MDFEHFSVYDRLTMEKSTRIEIMAGKLWEKVWFTIIGKFRYLRNWASDKARFLICLYVVFSKLIIVLKFFHVTVCWHRIAPTHSNALEHANDRQNDQHQRASGRTGLTGCADRFDRSGAENHDESRNASLGGTPSELAQLGLLWGRQATQNVFKRRRDEGRKQSRVGKD